VPTNPFEDEDGRYYALINDEGQYSLWPVFVDVPEGWTIAHGEDSRKACLDYIEENWTDMRPKSLIEEMAKYEKENGQAPRKRKGSPAKAKAATVRGTVVAADEDAGAEPAAALS
jgi:MbtH protein